MNADIEQLADEAIRLRWDYVRAADSIRPAIRDEIRFGLLATWAWCYPALDALAVQRETALGLNSVTPEEGCVIQVDAVTIHATQHDGPLRHCYSLSRAAYALAEGHAWLSTVGETSAVYVAVSDVWQPGRRYEGRTLKDAVQLLAESIARSEEIQRAGQRGDVQ